MKGDVKSVRVTATGAVFAGRTRLRGIVLASDGGGDIKWEHLGEMMDPRVQRITYEEVINGGDNATSGDPLHTKEGTRSSMGAGASERG